MAKEDVSEDIRELASKKWYFSLLNKMTKEENYIG